MSELSKIIMGAATHDEIVELLVEIAEVCKVEIPSKPEKWQSFVVRLNGCVGNMKHRAWCVDVYQDAHNNMMRA